ncbi:hypothetical protein AVEN_26279-1 [Araneus ventricosus]|uniref:Uncharacterized protein n=1 Tax=Araneus ventricosus TaxID=182803 RepID=A0A4Y2ANM6_ARAVE|nr:hypothetical protein AVEN_26279-1 [Araneus ventricosus]
MVFGLGLRKEIFFGLRGSFWRDEGWTGDGFTSSFEATLGLIQECPHSFEPSRLTRGTSQPPSSSPNFHTTPVERGSAATNLKQEIHRCFILESLEHGEEKSIVKVENL